MCDLTNVTIDPDQVWRAVETRDARFDGWVFCGVRTTGIYCRPSCPGRPKRENVRFFDSPAQARAAGLRACKRCRPDEVPVNRLLPAREPFAGDALVEFLARRAIPGIEEVADGAYRRSLRLEHGLGTVELAPAGDHVRASFRLDDPRDLDAAVERCRALLDLDTDPAAVDAALGGDPLLSPLVRSRPGRRVPGAVDGAELAVRAVLGQQISLAGAATLASRLTEAHGEPLERPLGTVTHAFPSADALTAADPGGWPMPRSRQRALHALASALAEGELSLDSAADGEVARARLAALPGVGPWTVEYVAMRALRDPDAFPASDLGVRHALERLGEDARPPAAQRTAGRWRPYRAYAVQHLWASLASPRSARLAA
jgi:AraC family transcriptional regulator of adaptative response / DNA-3-methyladenine glycosylase II